MRLNTITLKGFQSYREEETVTLDGINLAAIIGPNGAGKSTLINAVEFVLFGKYRGEGVNSVISRGATQAEVTVDFALNGSNYRVRRIKSTTRHEVYVTVEDPEAEDGWTVLSEKHPRVADQFLVDLLGMDYQTARTTWLIGQNDVDAFCEMRPSPRREVLTNAFGLNRYAEMATVADRNYSDASQRRDQAQFKLDQLTQRRDALAADVRDEELTSYTDAELNTEEQRIEEEDEKVSAALAADRGDITDLATKRDQAEQNLREARSAHERDVARYRSDLERATKDRDLADRTVRKVKAQRDEATEAAWDMDDNEADLEEARRETARIEEELPGLREKVNDLTTVISAQQTRRDATVEHGKEVKERIDMLSRTAHGHEGECFACGQSLSDERARSMREKLEQEKKKLLADHTDAQNLIKKAHADREATKAEITRIEKSLREAQRAATQAEQRYRDAARAAKTIPQLEADLTEAQEQLEAATKAYDTMVATPEPSPDTERFETLQAALAEAQDVLARAKEASNNRDELRRRRDELRSRQKRIWAEREHRTRVSDELESLVEPMKEATKEHSALDTDARTYEALRDAFRPDGIPAMILAGVIEELNDDANDVLAELGGTFGVNVTTQREKVTGGVEEKVMVYVTTPEGEIDYSTLSGSERFRCALAIRIALARCIARRTGTPMETVILDEGWGSLDDEYRLAVQEVLAELSNDFSVFTISHIEEVKSGFPTVIEVTKNDGTSRAQVHA